MDLKKKKIGLSIELDDQNQKDGLQEKLIRLVIGAAFLLGIWGMGRGLVSRDALFGGMVALCFLLLPDHRGKWGFPILLGSGVALLILGAVWIKEISGGLGAVGNEVVAILMQKTGYYFHRFETYGNTFAGDASIGLMLGLLVALVIRWGNPLPAAGLTMVVLALCVIGICKADLYLGLYFVGLLLYLSYHGSGNGRAFLLSAGMILATCGAVLIFGGYQKEVAVEEEKFTEQLHHWQYDCEGNPLPEGKLSNLGRWSPGSQAALEITMDQWQGVYLRGFTGSIYTGSGWKEESNAVLAENADFLYTLQKNYFHPYEQLSEAAKVLEDAESTQIRVSGKNACKAYAYLPYGIGGVGLDCRDLTAPSWSAYSGVLSDVADAYLIQKALSDGDGEQGYLDGEGAYKDFVYERCLELPEEVRTLMEEELGKADPTLTTSEIKEAVLDWVQQTLKYDEYASTRAGSKDLANYLVDTSPYGYCVHYATLTTLAMRYMGLPARYVEGYVVTRAEASAMGEGEIMVISQENAHAWTEYYLDGVGWVPFDTTPGYEKELIYHMPPDGTGLQNRPPQEETEPTEPEEPPVKQDPDPSSQTKQNAVKIVYHLLLAAVVLAILGFILRIIVLRRKLKQRIDRFRQDNTPNAMLDCVAYQFEILALLGLEKRNVPLSRQAADISQILFGDDAKPFVNAVQELQFSNHTVSEEQRNTILSGLDRVLHVWHQVTPKGKKLRTKWLNCQVL